MRELYEFGIPLQRIVHVNFDDDRLKGLKLEHLRLRILDSHHVQLCLTGSSPKMLSRRDRHANAQGCENDG